VSCLRIAGASSVYFALSCLREALIYDDIYCYVWILSVVKMYLILGFVYDFGCISLVDDMAIF